MKAYKIPYKSKDKTKPIICYKCGKAGHYAKHYRVKQKIKNLKILEETKQQILNILEQSDNEESSDEELEVMLNELKSSSSNTESEPNINLLPCGSCSKKYRNILTTEEKETLTNFTEKLPTDSLKIEYLKTVLNSIIQKSTVKPFTSSQTGPLDFTSIYNKFHENAPQITISDLH